MILNSFFTTQAILTPGLPLGPSTSRVLLADAENVQRTVKPPLPTEATGDDDGSAESCGGIQRFMLLGFTRAVTLHNLASSGLVHIVRAPALSDFSLFSF
jgi:hypothetical protein